MYKAKICGKKSLKACNKACKECSWKKNTTQEKDDLT